MIWILIVNALLYVVTKYPRLVLDQNNFFFVRNTHKKEFIILRWIKKFVIKFFKVFLVRDKSNNLTLICFCNAILILSIFEVSQLVESLLISIAAACIFHYFVVAIPEERKKIFTVRKFSHLMQDFMQRDDCIYLINRTHSKEFEINKLDEYERERFTHNFLSKMSFPVGGKDNQFVLNDIRNPIKTGFVNKNDKMSDIWNIILEYDKNFLLEMKSIDLSTFPDLSISIDIFQSQYVNVVKFAKPNQWYWYFGYLNTRQNVIAEYVNTAGNYAHGHELRFRDYKGIKSIHI
ncbi:hypothetical protein KCG43_19005 [Photobacterium sp. WH24]|uniref:hypothetical protein n=1 Tax=Photobacterium sp. WH24 TaxID=2827237 RepID=UPI001C43B60B|nr:hypothetical protein [Photobacterium sp. WH24]MBV7264104.1 hypothetical protein [Photobacterium sp. WH24]